MARGFESKSVADQQEAAVSSRRTGVEGADPARLLKRRKLELGRADVLQRLQQAHAPAHRQMLEQALAALERDLATLA
jgi:hypothetical protein